MIDFKGFDGWVEIFSGGTQRDGDGKTHDGDTLIEAAVATFDPSFHEPPAVVGHPKDNAPAYGWVKELKAETGKEGVKRLFAKFSQVVPEFADAVKQGLYKKRSASFYPDGRLRHVGFLGAAPPAVKALKDIAFADGEAITFEFSETSPWTWDAILKLFRNVRDYILERDGKEKADSIIPEWNLEDIAGEKDRAKQPVSKGEDDMKMEFSEFLEAFKFWKKTQGADSDATRTPTLIVGANNHSPLQPAPHSTAQFSEADIEAAKKQGAEEAKKTLAAEARKKEIADFCDALVKDGRIPPSWIKGGLVEFMQQLDAEGELEFSEGKKTALAYFKEFLEGMTKFDIFRDLATKERAADGADFSEGIPYDLARYV